MGVSWVCRGVNHKYDQLSHSQSQLARRMAALDFVSTFANTKTTTITDNNLQKLR